jgi:pilus assembly protein Flp/PilA
MMFGIGSWLALQKNEKGATAIEYALIAGGIALAIVAPVAFMGEGLSSTYTTIGGFFQQ